MVYLTTFYRSGFDPRQRKKFFSVKKRNRTEKDQNYDKEAKGHKTELSNHFYLRQTSVEGIFLLREGLSI